MSFNIASKRAVETTEVKIIDPSTGEQLVGEGGKLASVTVYGPASKIHIAAQSAANARLIKRAQAKGSTEETADEALAAKAAFLTDITVSFNNFSYGDMPDGPEAWRACYADAGLGWLANQVDRGGGNWGNFTPVSSTN